MGDVKDARGRKEMAEVDRVMVAMKGAAHIKGGRRKCAYGRGTFPEFKG